jgi:hypothetical protein
VTIVDVSGVWWRKRARSVQRVRAPAATTIAISAAAARAAAPSGVRSKLLWIPTASSEAPGRHLSAIHTLAAAKPNEMAHVRKKSQAS